MNYITVGTTFIAGTKARASQVNSNFDSILNGLNAGTSDIYIGAMQKKSIDTAIDYPITDTDGVSVIYVTTSTTNRTITLPTVADNTNRIITICKADSGAGTDSTAILTIAGEGAELIDDANTVTGVTSIYDFVTVQSDGTKWHIINKKFSTEDGLKQYDGGSTYNGVALNVTGYGDTTTPNNDLIKAIFIPYKTESGWRIRFNIAGTLDAAATICSLAIAGMTSKNVASFTQALVGLSNSGITHSGYISNGSNTIVISSANTTAYRCAGDIELDSKPTWAD